MLRENENKKILKSDDGLTIEADLSKNAELTTIPVKNSFNYCDSTDFDFWANINLRTTFC